MRGANRVVVWKPEGKRSLGRPWRRWEDHITMDIKKWDGRMVWIDLAEDSDRWLALVNEVMNNSFP